MHPLISAIVTFHNEGSLADYMLSGFDRMRRFSEKNGLSVELVAVLDCADSETVRIVKEHQAIRKTDKIIETKHGDLGASRNEGIKNSLGEFVGIFDGDDYHSENWLTEAYRAAKQKKGDAVIHPSMTASFGSTFCIAKSIDMDDSSYSMSSCFTHHPWTSSVFGIKKIFQDHPYVQTKTQNTGFGYEDWHWNLELVSSGIRHISAPVTALFYRRKPTSLLMGMLNAKAILRPASFFEKPEFFQPAEAPASTERQALIRRIAEKAWLSTTKPFMRIPPRKYRAGLNHFVKGMAAAIAGRAFIPEHKEDNQLRLGVLPQWIIQELLELSKIEPDLAPTPTMLSKFQFYAPPNEGEPGYAYGECLKALDGFRPDMIFLVPWLTRGGADLGTLYHAQAAIACGKKVLVISTLELDSPLAHRIQELPGGKFLELGKITQGLTEERKLLVLTRLLLQLPAQTIHTINSELGWKAIRDHGKCFQTLGKHCYGSAFCEDIGEDGRPWGYVRFYLSDCLPWLTGFMCDTQWYPGEIQKSFGLPTDKMYPVYFPAPLTPVATCRSKPTRKVLWFSRPCKQKRLDLLLGIANAIQDAQFIINGFGPDIHGYCKETKRITEELKQLPNVVVIESTDSIKQAIDRDDFALFLYTSGWDGLPFVLKEVTSLGLPVVASAVGGVSELVSEESGYPVFDANNIQAYVIQIERALASPEEREQKWERAAALLKESHSLENFITVLKNIPHYIPA